MKSGLQKLLVAVVVLLLVVLVGGVAFLRLNFYAATLSLEELSEVYDSITFEIGSHEIRLIPENPRATGVILYPGGNVDFRAYARLGAGIAEEGFPVFLVRMPLDLAVLQPNRAQTVIRAHPHISPWVVAGHSLGGAMAVRYALSHQNKVDGVILYASYADRDLSDTGLAVLSLVGTEDGVLNWSRYEEGLEYLPASALVQSIAGGNHCYFGDYGFQRGDNPASITRDQQQALAVRETVAFLRSIAQQ